MPFYHPSYELDEHPLILIAYVAYRIFKVEIRWCNIVPLNCAIKVSQRMLAETAKIIVCRKEASILILRCAGEGSSMLNLCKSGSLEERETLMLTLEAKV